MPHFLEASPLVRKTVCVCIVLGILSAMTTKNEVEIKRGIKVPWPINFS